MVRITEIEDRKVVKPYLGGWRHKITDTKYLNGASQTGPPPKNVSWHDYCSVAVQTVETKDGTTQSPYDRATQMWRCDGIRKNEQYCKYIYMYFQFVFNFGICKSRKDCHISSTKDKYMTPEPYEMYDEKQWRLDLDGNAKIIQRNYRLYRLRKYLKECARKYREIMKECRKYQEDRIMMYRKRHEEELLRKIYPRSRADFDMLYELIERWKRDRMNEIKTRYFQATQRAENCFVLKRVVEMFNVIDKLKQEIREQHRANRRVKFLKMSSKPIRWHGYKGKLIEMDTLKTQKAREFLSIYNSLSKNNVSVEDRIELLIMLKKSLEYHTCVSAFDLTYLLDQEMMLLSRGMKNLSLDYLRKRILCDYLQFVATAGTCACTNVDRDFVIDPECEELREPLETRTIFCRSCRRILPYYRFSPHGGLKKLTSCTSCTSLSERNYSHVNYDPYIFILNCVRAEEKRRECFSALAFMMQPRDMYHLINNIWHGHSAISKKNDIHALRMVRYDQRVEWSPWNCILLTEDEAEIHYSIKDFTTVYSKALLHQILLKHLTAKNYFKRLSEYDRRFRESSRFYMIQDRKDYERPKGIFQEGFKF